MSAADVAGALYHLLRAETALVAALRDDGHDPSDSVASADALKRLLAVECAPTTSISAVIERERGPETILVLVQGGYPRSRDWPAYLESIPPPLRPHIGAIRRALADVDLNEMPSGRIFACSDGIRVAFTDNAWGDLRSSMVGCGGTFEDYR